MNEIKINHKQLSEEVLALRKAIELFEPYTTGYVKKIANSLDEGNSDFLTEVKKTLRNMSDTVAPKLLEDLQQIEIIINKTTVTFQEVDAVIAKELERKE